MKNANEKNEKRKTKLQLHQQTKSKAEILPQTNKPKRKHYILHVMNVYGEMLYIHYMYVHTAKRTSHKLLNKTHKNQKEQKFKVNHSKNVHTNIPRESVDQGGSGLDIVMSGTGGVVGGVVGGIGLNVNVGLGVTSSSNSAHSSLSSSNNNNNNNNGNNEKSGTATASGNGSDDLNTLEAEISELQRENARVESQMMRLKSDINAMESQLSTSDREASPLSGHQQQQRSSNVTMASPSGQSPFASVSSTSGTGTGPATSSSNNNGNGSNDLGHSISSLTPGSGNSNPNTNVVGMMSHAPVDGGVAPPNANLNNYYESLRNNVITLLEHVRLPPPPAPPTSVSVSASIAGGQVVAGHGLDSVCAGGQLVAGSGSDHATAYSTLLPPPPPPPTASSGNIGGGMYGHQGGTGAGGGPPPGPPPVPPHHAYTVHHPVSYAHPHSHPHGHPHGHHPHPHPHEHFDSYISKLQSLCVPPDVYALPDDAERTVYNSVKPSMHQDYGKLMPTPI